MRLRIVVQSSNRYPNSSINKKTLLEIFSMIFLSKQQLFGGRDAKKVYTKLKDGASLVN